MTAEWLWALKPGFQCYSAKKGKSANSRLFFFALGAYAFCRPNFFFTLLRSFYGFALASTKAVKKEKHGCPPLQLWPPLGIHFHLYESYALRYLNTSTYLTVRYIDNLSSFGLA
jgi:hypothetical protein